VNETGGARGNVLPDADASGALLVVLCESLLGDLKRHLLHAPVHVLRRKASAEVSSRILRGEQDTGTHGHFDVDVILVHRCCGLPLLVGHALSQAWKGRACKRLVDQCPSKVSAFKHLKGNGKGATAIANTQ
jgi:hypothetical protein